MIESIHLKTGTPASSGLAIAKTFVIKNQKLEVTHQKSASFEIEKERFLDAVHKSKNDLLRIQSHALKKIGKEPVLLSLPPIDSAKYFDYISKKLNADNILKWMEGNKQFLTLEMICNIIRG